MKKIDYALENIPKPWDDINEREVLKCLCPSDFNLDDIEECRYTDVNFTPCEKCWDEEIEVMI